MARHYLSICINKILNRLGVQVFLITTTTALLLTCPVTSLAANNKVVGVPRIIDGDTLSIDGKRIRLHGIDAPENKQYCTKDGNSWHCGRKATEALSRMVSGNMIECVWDKRDRYKRLIAICYLEDLNLNANMVKEGWALAYIRYSDDYVEQEQKAQKEFQGIWAGEFVPPWDWRNH